jgi:hypothetical protein
MNDENHDQQQLSGEMVPRTPQEHWAANKRQYAEIFRTLEEARKITLHGDRRVAAHNLKTAYVFAVLSQRQPVEPAEQAVTEWADGVPVRQAAAELQYPNQKTGWIKDGLENFPFEKAVFDLREHSPWNVVAEMADKLKGVSHRKAAFTVAMAGMTETACLDVNLQYLAEQDIPQSFNSVGHYREVVDEVLDDQGLGFLDPFEVQWVMFDFRRGGVTTHSRIFHQYGGMGDGA